MFKSKQMGIYIHWPFCKSRCPYCDFNTYVRQRDFDEDLWLKAYIRELDYYASMLSGREVVSIFFGGGTPSLMSVDAVGQLIEHVRGCWDVSGDVEVTLEANPTSVENAKLRGFAGAGVNRLSLGVQSLHDDGLEFLGREHNVAEAMEALDMARMHFTRFSFDLIYARPGQSLEDWQAELENALDIGASHMSLYQLTVAEGTPFYKRVRACSEEDGAAFYNLTQDIMDAAGLPAYEVSNHARAGQECRHNLVYWQWADYIGIGAGAHGRYMLDGRKYAVCNDKKPERWLAGDCAKVEELDEREQFYEKLLMGLRLYKGLLVARDCKYLDFDKVAVAECEGWLAYDGAVLKATREGMLRLNALLGYIIS